MENMENGGKKGKIPPPTKKKKAKKKDKFGFNSSEHATMLTKLQAVEGISKADLFESRIFAIKNELVKYIEHDLIPDAQVSLIIFIFSRICLSNDEQILSMISNLMHSALMQKQFSTNVLKWTTQEEHASCMAKALACLDVFESCLRIYPYSLKNIAFDAFANFIRYLKSDTLTQRLDRFLHSQYKVLMRVSQTSNAPRLRSRQVSQYTSYMSYDDFRRLPTFPTEDDIHSTEKIALRPIVTSGSYDSGEDFLDIHYRLVREDLISPLRDGIREIVEKKENKIRLTVYSGVKVLYPLCSFRGVVYRICFDNSNFYRFPWQHSRKLIFGSLLCFTCDNFKSMIFGTVANREVYLLNEGILDVRFENSELVHSYCNGKLLCMVESPSFFEAYRHVMDCLKEVNPFLLPMKQYILNCDTDIKLPRYLENGKDTLYDLTGAFGVSFKNVPAIRINKVVPHGTDLNASQLRALQHALLNEFTVIQGPPGTGKTFCGLRIAHCLLSNQHAWNKNKDTPMLVVCYTNHALDQFLSGLIAFGHRNIIRVGGRANEDMEAYLLKTALQNFRRRCWKSGTHKLLMYQRNITSEARDMFANELGPYMISVKKYQEAIRRGKLVLFNDVKHCIDPNHADYFEEQEKHCIGLNISIFDIFLELCQIPLAILKNVSRCNSSEQTSGRDYEPVVSRFSFRHHSDQKGYNELIDVVGEGNALVERWVIDEHEYAPLVTENINFFDYNEDVDDSMFVDDDGFKLVTMSKRDKQRKVRSQINAVEAMTSEETQDVGNPWHLSITDRWRLYKYWLNKFMKNYDSFIEMKIQQYEDACEETYQVKEREQEVVLRSANVIAMTTTCAGRMRHVLQSIKPKIVVVEEAAEVLEAHVIASLIKETEHCILIGDHKQLRPSPEVHELKETYHLDLSLFERMVNNDIECPSLDVQHRMRPTISYLLRHIYPKLTDHDSVMTYENVLGVEKNLFFINHSESETQVRKTASKSNAHEASFMRSLCLYLLQQGYEPNQITVLTGYSGQLLQLKSVMPKCMFEGVKVTSVDNYQGEENDIILLSLVRSNSWGSIGFLSIENRICVALSRAKKGLYVIGNFDLLEEKSNVWRHIVSDAKNMRCFGYGLPLVCQNHPEKKIIARRTEDFDLAPEGGCDHACGYLLPCGHTCDAFCHPFDRDHEEYECQEACPLSPCGDPDHTCPQSCHFGQNCVPCWIQVEKTFQSCGHTQPVPCYVKPEESSCQVACENFLKCGHSCPKKCGEECSTSDHCEASVEKALECGHSQNIMCSKKIAEAECRSICNEVLWCGHTCQGTCGECLSGNFHVKCTQRCMRILDCYHQCNQNCHESCLPCQLPCEWSCPHMKCMKRCGEPCEPCTEPCKRRCEHRQCTRLCGQICDVEPCDMPCKEVLKCGHPCAGVCGETCLSACRICSQELFHDAGKPNLYIWLNCCQNMVEKDACDRLMSLGRDNELHPVKFIKCPACEKMLRCSRYRSSVVSVKEDLVKIKVFEKDKDLQRVERLLRQAFSLCQVIAFCLLQRPLQSKIKKDYRMILSRIDISSFKDRLDLRYLARKETKSNLLLLAERLVTCRCYEDCRRVFNQMSLKHLVILFEERVQEAGSLDGQAKWLKEDLEDISDTMMDPKLTVQEAKNIFVAIEGLFYKLQAIICQRYIRKRLKTPTAFCSKEASNLSHADTNMKCMLKELDCRKYLGPEDMTRIQNNLETLSQEFAIKMPTIAFPTLLTDVVVVTNEWWKCDQHHLFRVIDDDYDCPKCFASVANEFTMDLSLDVSNELFYSPCGSERGFKDTTKAPLEQKENEGLSFSSNLDCILEQWKSSLMLTN